MRYLLLSLVFLVGCLNLARDDSEYTWYHSGRPALPMEIDTVNEWPDAVKRRCPVSPLLYACAIIYVNSQGEYSRCVVYTKSFELSKETFIHEKKHCDGYDHKEP